MKKSYKTVPVEKLELGEDGRRRREIKEYFVDDFEEFDLYKKFIQYMLEHSDFFSLIYFKERENSPVRKSVRQLRDQLRKFKLYSMNTMEWPNTKTFDTRHIYNMAFYYADMECLDILCQVCCFYDWDYPDAPMDLCFYRDGYCLFAATAHEEMYYLYTDDKETVNELTQLGAVLTFMKDESKVFHIDLSNKLKKYEKRFK